MKELGTIFKETLNNIIDGVLFIDRDYKIIFANKSAAKLFGKKEQDIIGRDCGELYGGYSVHLKEGSATLKCPCIDVFSSKEPSIVTNTLITSDGKEVILHVTATPIINEAGEVTQILEILRDVTEEKQSTDEIKRKNIELNTFIDSIPDMAWFKDTDSNFIIVNRAFADVVGMDPEYLVNNTCEVCFGKKAAKKFKEDDAKVINSRKKIVIEEAIEDAQGNKIYLETIKTPLVDESGIVVGTIGVARNINERRLAEELLQQSEEKNINLINNIDDLIYSVDIKDNMFEGETFFVSSQSENITGYAAHEFMDNPKLWLSIINPEDIAIVEKDTRRVLENKERVVRSYRIRHKITGADIWLEDKVSPKIDDKGNVVGLFGVARDVTERRRIEEQLKLASEVAEQEKIKTEAIISSIGDALGIVDTEFRVVYQNEVSKKMFGDYVGQYCYRAYRQRDDICDGCPVFAAMKDGTIQRVERTANIKSGERCLEITASPLRDSSGNIIGGVEVVRDTTDRKLAEEEIFHYGERLRLLREIDHAILTAQSSEKIVRVALDHLKELVPCSLASIVAFDFGTGKAVELAVYSKDNPRVREGNSITLGKYDLKEGLYFGDVNVTEDLSTLPDPSDMERSLNEKGVRSYINVPIIHLDELMGSINIGRGKPGAFTAEDVTIASEVADLLAVAIQSGRADKELRASEKKYRNLVDNALVGVYKTNLKGDIIYVNDALIKIGEYNSSDEMLSSKVASLYRREEDREKLIEELKEKGVVENYETELVTPTGTIKNILITASLQDEEISGMLMDITKLREAEEAIKESETFLSSILEGIKDGVVVLDKDYRILFANASYAEQIGSKSEDLKGRFCHEVTYNRDEPCFLSKMECIVKDVFDTGISSRDVRRKGERYMEMTVYPLKDASGNVVSVVEIRRDVTRNIALDEELKERIRELEEFYDMAVGRELKMKSLKEEIEELHLQLKKRQS